MWTYLYMQTESTTHILEEQRATNNGAKDTVKLTYRNEFSAPYKNKSEIQLT